MANRQGLAQLIKDVSDNPTLAPRLRMNSNSILEKYDLASKEQEVLASGDADAIQILVKEAAGRMDPSAILIYLLAVGHN